MPTLPHGPKAPLQHVVGELGLMATMERAHAEVGHADRESRPVVGRAADRGGEGVVRGWAEALHRGGGTSGPSEPFDLSLT